MMSITQEFIIEKRVSLAKYTDIKHNFILNKINYNCISKLMMRLRNELNIFVEDLFKYEYGMDVSAFTYSINEVDEERYIDNLLFTKSLNYSITLSVCEPNENLKEFIDYDDENDEELRDIYDLVVYKDKIELYSYCDGDLYKTYRPETLSEIHEFILDEYNNKIHNIRSMTRNQLVCNTCGVINIEDVLVDQHNRVYDSRKCRLDE